MRRTRAMNVAAGMTAAFAIAALAFILFGPLALGIRLLERAGLKLNRPASPPIIAQSVDFNWPGNWSDNPQWNAVLAQHFPAGSDESLLRVTLFAEGFQIDERGRTARYEWGGIPCLYTLRVNWSAAEGKIKAVNGGFGMGCL